MTRSCFLKDDFLVLLLLLTTNLLLLKSTSASSTIRYRPGVLTRKDHDDKDVEYLLKEIKDTTVALGREECRNHPECISFAYLSGRTRFPGSNVTIYLFKAADWHLMSKTGRSAFIEDPQWHTYTNNTRELEALPGEIELLLKKFDDKSSSLRGGGTSLKKFFVGKASLISSLYHIVLPLELRTTAAPLLVPTLKEIAMSTENGKNVREAAMAIIHVIADCPETSQLLLDAGIYPSMKQLVDEGSSDWDRTRKLALDIIANLCFHRAVNDKLKKLGAPSFLRGLLNEPGFYGLEAAMALAHISNDDIDLPKDKVQDLMGMLRDTINGDISYGIRWDLIPGPLSAIQYLVEHHHHKEVKKRKAGNIDDNNEEENADMDDYLLDAGLMEHLLRILESECTVAGDIEATLRILHHLSSVSERARNVILLAEHALRDAGMRLRKFAPVADLAEGVVNAVAKYDFFGKWEHEL